jgi:hypothetical protein
LYDAATTWALAKYSGEFEKYHSAWEKHYFRRRTPDGSAAPEHQTKLDLLEFAGQD